LPASSFDHAHDIISDLMNTVVSACARRSGSLNSKASGFFLASPTRSTDRSPGPIESAYFATASGFETSRGVSLPVQCLQQDAGPRPQVRHHMASSSSTGWPDVRNSPVARHRHSSPSEEHVNVRLGGHAYALYPTLVQAMDIDSGRAGFVEQSESIDIIGEVKCWSRSEEAWVRENYRQRNEVTARQCDKAHRVRHRRAARERVGYFTLP